MQDHINASGHLDVGDGHKIYWEDWGNPRATPIFSLHGGPGASFNDNHKLIYDPKVHRVIFHDQRGAGRSTPFASTEHNTTPDLIADIEKLREHLGINSMHVSGGSWGSALTLMYTIAHPDRVKSMLIWGVYTVTQLQDDWVNAGYPKHNFPDEWDRFIALVPEGQRHSGDSIQAFYAKMMRSDDGALAQKYAIEWTLWESCLLSIGYDPATVEAEVRNDPDTLAIALLETHYFSNQCFVPQNHISDNLATIKHIPCYVVQGRFDMCTPPIGAYDLAKAYGEKLELHWVNSGHLRTDYEMRVLLTALAATKFV